MYRKTKKEEFYTRKAKEEGYPARSVYKLKEIDEKYKIFKQGDRVLDLGCVPGSWMMYIAQKIKPLHCNCFAINGKKGEVTGVDTDDLKIVQEENMIFIQEDVAGLKVERFTDPEKRFDAVVSDMSPKTSGIKSADALNSIVLADKALAIAKLTLRPGGKFVCKIFEGKLAERFFKEVKKSFEFIKRFRPKAVVKESREIYVIGLGYRG